MSFGNDDAPNPYAPTASTLQSDPYQSATGGGQQLATRGERFAGAFVDGLIMMPLALGLGFAMGMALVASGIDPASPMFNIAASVVGGLIGAGLFLIVNGYLLATKGQTVGKLVVKTQIVSEQTDQILPFGEVVLKRYVPFWVLGAIPMIGGIFGLANALAIFRENRKCIHDEIASTKVIKL